jgi:hypothetical protein
MMIDFGEAEIFERQVSKALNGVIGRELAFADFVEKLADGFGVQGGTQQSALSIQTGEF